MIGKRSRRRIRRRRPRGAATKLAVPTKERTREEGRRLRHPLRGGPLSSDAGAHGIQASTLRQRKGLCFFKALALPAIGRYFGGATQQPWQSWRWDCKARCRRTDRTRRRSSVWPFRTRRPPASRERASFFGRARWGLAVFFGGGRFWCVSERLHGCGLLPAKPQAVPFIEAVGPLPRRPGARTH